MIKKIYRFTLIEIIIATVLFSTLIFSTTSLFFRYHKISAYINSIRPIIFQRTMFFEKMKEMTASVDLSTIKVSSPQYNEFLSFTFDNGFKDNADLSGKCKCELFRTEEKKLFYIISNNKGKELKRPLLEDVTFFSPLIKDKILFLTIEDIHGNHLEYSFNLLNTPSKEQR